MPHPFLYPASTIALFILFALIGAAVAPATPRGIPATTRMGLGFSVFVFLSVFPLYFAKSFAVTIAAALLLAVLGLRRTRFVRPKWGAETVFGAASAVNLLLLSWGTAAHAGLGDHDPYEHAMAVSWLYETANIFPPAPVWRELATLDPYPPGYDAGAAAIAVAAGGVAEGLRIWALAAAAMFPVAVRFFTRASGFTEKTAAIAGAISVLLTPAPTHFAWTHTAAIPLTLIGAGALAFCIGSARWIVPAAAALAAYGFSATSEVFYGLLLFVPLAVRGISQKKAAAPLAAAGLSLLLFSGWGWHAAGRLREGAAFKAPGYYFTLRAKYDAPDDGRKWYNTHRGNARPYGAEEFFLPRRINYFNIPVGLPAAGTVLGLWGFYLLWKRKRLVWPAALFIFFMVAAQGERLPVEFFPHRAWTYLALLTALASAYALRDAIMLPGRWKSRGRVMAAGLAFVAALSFGHSLWVRARMESLQWENEIFTGGEQRQGFYRLPYVLGNQKAWPVSGGIRHGYIAALGGRALFWGEKERSADAAFEKGDYPGALQLLEEAGYRFLVLDATVDLRFGEGAGDRIGQAIVRSGRWTIADQRDGFAFFSLNSGGR